MVVAVLLILSVSSTELTGASVLLLSGALVVIPVISSLVLGVLLLILIPGVATCAAHVSTLFVPTLVIVVSTATLVASLAPAVARLAVLVSLRVLS